ncbi:MAG: T9SS type A sorting domain-containing protein [Candidatus Eisenbacteria bacterium]
MPTDFGTGTSIGLGDLAAYGNFLGVALVYDDFSLYRVRLAGNDGSSGSDYQAALGVTYSVRITYDGANATLELAADGVPDFTDTLPYEPRAFDHFRFGIDYPGQAICGPDHYWWDQAAGWIGFCVDRDTGAYLRGWIDNVSTPGCQGPAPEVCYDFDLWDEGLYDHEYPQLPGYASAAIDVPSGEMQPGDVLQFVVRVNEGAVPSEFGTGTSIGLGDLAVYGNFLGVALIYDDLDLYRIRLAGNDGTSGVDYQATVGVTYTMSIHFDGANAVLDLAADGVPDFTDTLPYEPRHFDHFRMGIDYPGEAICGPNHYVWDSAEGRIDFCVDRDTGPYLHGWIDDISIPGCASPGAEFCYDFDSQDEGLFAHEYPQLPGYGSAAIAVPSGQMQPGDILQFVVRVDEGDVPTEFGTGTSIGLGDLASYGNFLGVALVYDDFDLYRIRLSGNGESTENDYQAQVGVTYTIKIRYDGYRANLEVDADGVPDFIDQMPYEPRFFDHFRMGIDYPGQAICGPEHYWWDQVAGHVGFCVDRDTGAYLRGLVDDVCLLRLAPSEVVEPAPLDQLMLSAAPNPFAGGTSFRFALPSRQRVELSVFDSGGRLVERILNETLDAGVHNVPWHAPRSAAGVYFARVRGETGQQQAKVLILK